MGVTVLVADDDADVRAVCRALLELEGHTVVETSGGEDVAALVHRADAAVALLDVTPPRMDGWRTLARIRADQRLEATRVVLLTARATEDDRRRAASQGADEYATKPVAPRLLSHLVADLLATGPEEAQRRSTRMADLLGRPAPDPDPGRGGRS